MRKYYEIYINEYKWFNPANYKGMVIVLNESDDSLINNWCYKKIGEKYQVIKGRGLIQIWNWMLVDEPDENILTTIQRKSSTL